MKKDPEDVQNHFAMFTAAERDAEDQYEARYDGIGGDVPSGDFQDDSYVGKTEPVPVLANEDPNGDPVQPPESNSDEELDKWLIVSDLLYTHCKRGGRFCVTRDGEVVVDYEVFEERTRHATPRKGTYTEPGDDSGSEISMDTGAKLRLRGCCTDRCDRQWILLHGTMVRKLYQTSHFRSFQTRIYHHRLIQTGLL